MAPLDDTTPRVRKDAGTAARILLVGTHLSADHALHESLRLRGYAPLLARNERDALRTLETISPDLVLAETQLGRFEGIELIPELRMVPGVEEIPVVLVDSEMRPERRGLRAARGLRATSFGPSRCRPSRTVSRA